MPEPKQSALELNGEVVALPSMGTRVDVVVVGACPSMLSRPDGCIAWADHAGEGEGLADALERWFALTPLRPGGSR